MPSPSSFVPQVTRTATRPAEASSGRGFDQQAMQKIEASRKRHAACRDIRVRALADEGRLAAEETSQIAAIKEAFDVTGVAELRAHCISARAAATAEIEAYVARVDAVVDALVALGESV